jgi:hypothetical protein
MDGEANVFHAINDHDAADHIVEVLAILMQIRDRYFPVGAAVNPNQGMKCGRPGQLTQIIRTGYAMHDDPAQNVGATTLAAL